MSFVERFIILCPYLESPLSEVSLYCLHSCHRRCVWCVDELSTCVYVGVHVRV